MNLSPCLARLVHISDLHFSCPPTNPLNYLSKRFLAYSSQFFSAKRRFSTELIDKFLDFLKNSQATHLVISGDLTLTGSKDEFREVEAFLAKVVKMNINLLIVPGNHDVYLKRAIDLGLYPLLEQFINKKYTHDLYTNRVALLQDEHLNFIVLDQTQPTPWGSAKGYFDQTTDQKLKNQLEQAASSKRLLVIGHYPLYQMEKASHELNHYDLVVDTLKTHSNLIGYLHGHCHHAYLRDDRAAGNFISIDAGSLGSKQKSSFVILEIYEKCIRANFKTLSLKDNVTDKQTFLWSKSLIC
jgi:3',5'-cyclic AMP phosphodiesterase CpdA